MTRSTREEVHLCRYALTGYSVITKPCVREERRKKEGERVWGGHIVKKNVELFTVMTMMREDELENTVEEIPLLRTTAH